MPGVSKAGTKIFVGNLANDVISSDIRKLFEKYGAVTECDVLKNYGFVHMDTAENAEEAISALNGHNLYGQAMVVEASTGGRRDSGSKKGGTKIFIGNLPSEATPDYVRKKFEQFGTVMECDILKNYGFVHLDTPENAQKCIRELHGSEVFGQKMTVEASTSDVRRNPGMGGADRCFRCGSSGHWSKICPETSYSRRRFSMRARSDVRGAPYLLPRDRYRPYERYDPYGYYDDRYLPPRRLAPPLSRRLTPPPYISTRSPPPYRDYSSYGFEHRHEYRRDDPYRRAAEDYYYRREYYPSHRDYSPISYSKSYITDSKGRYGYSASRYSPSERNLPRAYGGSGRMSPVRR